MRPLHTTIDDLRERSWSRREAFAYCSALARSHYENFTVGSLLLPSRLRPHIHNLYAFCRWADDLGDEVGDPLESLRLLDSWEDELDAAYRGRPRHPVFIALSHTIAEFGIPPDPFRNLIEAFRRDQSRNRYLTFSDILDYCEYSANPVGRLFLYVFGYRDEARARIADRTCTALQLTNFWQDVAVDYSKGRIYIPMRDMARFDVSETDIAEGRTGDGWRSLMAFQVERTRTLFREGRRLIGTVSPSLRTDLALFSLGGEAILDAIERVDYDVFTRRPTLSKAGKFLLLVRGLSRGLLEGSR